MTEQDILFNYWEAAMVWERSHRVHPRNKADELLVLSGMEKKMKALEVSQKIHPNEYAGEL